MIVKKLNRLSRNHRDVADIEELVEKHGLGIHFRRDSQVLDKSSPPSAWLTKDINLAVARHHGKNLSIEVRKGLDERAGAGSSRTATLPSGAAGRSATWGSVQKILRNETYTGRW